MTELDTSRVASLTDGRLLRRGVALNLATAILPAAVALVCIPVLARALGAERFGLLALAWAAVGVFSLFDFGIGRTLTRLVAERLATHRDAELRDLVWSASWLLLGATLVLGLVGVVLAPIIADRVMHVPPALRAETIGVIQLLSVCIAPLAHGVVLRGVLEGAQRFGLANAFRLPLGIATYAGPLVALRWPDARVAVAAVVIARALYWLAHVPALSRVTARLGRPQLATRSAVRELVSVGGWITVSSIVSPLIVYSDRLAIAALLPIAASGWYGTAAEIGQRQYLFTAALTPVLFAALAASMATAPDRAAQLMARSSRVTLFALLGPAVALVAFAEPGLQWWLGSAYMPETAQVLRWLAVGVYVNAFGQIAYAVLQSGVDSRGPAVLHVIELPLFLIGLFVVTPRWGVTGVALLWAARMVLDTAALWALLYRTFTAARGPALAAIRLALACAAIVAAIAAWGARIW